MLKNCECQPQSACAALIWIRVDTHEVKTMGDHYSDAEPCPHAAIDEQLPARVDEPAMDQARHDCADGIPGDKDERHEDAVRREKGVYRRAASADQPAVAKVFAVPIGASPGRVIGPQERIRVGVSSEVVGVKCTGRSFGEYVSRLLSFPSLPRYMTVKAAIHAGQVLTNR